MTKMPSATDKMTVAELIEKLQAIEDKNKELKYADWSASTSISSVRDEEDVVSLFFYR